MLNHPAGNAGSRPVLLWLLVFMFFVHSAPLTAADGFVGSATCAECHQAEFEAWQGSHHDLAMQHASAGTVLGDFDNAEITVGGVTTRFFRRDGRFFVHTDGPGGVMADFEIAYTFGVYPLQQYLVPFDDGRIQALGLAWDSRPAEAGGQRWFHLYPDLEISHGDELHWTGRQQNWNYQCADCHSTHFVKAYDAEADRFDSHWSELNVACEACHGPGQAHIDAVAAADAGALRSEDVEQGLSILLPARGGKSWQMNANTGIAYRVDPGQDSSELEVCAVCHSRRGTIAAGAQSDPHFLNQHMPAFLTEGLYFSDGQIDDEVYVWGSFVQSKMHRAGVVCSDCHEPHSLALKYEGDAVCSQCHLPAKYALTAHHGHPQAAESPACVDCHMPERTYMVVDPRRDHSIRIPHPKLTQRFGVPNACSQCHSEQDLDWAIAAYDDLFPQAAQPYQSWTSAFSQARAGLPQAEVSLMSVANNKALPELARATAIVELADFLSPVSGEVVQAALHDESALVRLAALRALEPVPAEHRFALAGHLLGDPLLAVRAEAGRVLASTAPAALSPQDQQRLSAALADYESTQRYNADRPESWMNLGNVHARTGDMQRAEDDYLRAIELAPDFDAGYLNLADLYRHQGREIEVISVLQDGLEQAAGSAALHHAHGLALVRAGDQATALESLARAVDLAPGSARYAYVYAVGLNSAGRAPEALAVLSDAHQRHPVDLQLLQLLAMIERDRGQFDEARRWVQRALDINPADPGLRQLLQSLPPAGTPQ